MYKDLEYRKTKLELTQDSVRVQTTVFFYNRAQKIGMLSRECSRILIVEWIRSASEIHPSAKRQ